MIAKQVRNEISRIIREHKERVAPWYPNGNYEVPLALRSALRLAEEFELGIIELNEARIWYETLKEERREYEDAPFYWDNDLVKALDLIDEMLEEEMERIRWARARAALRRKEESEKASRFSLGSVLKAAMGG